MTVVMKKLVRQTDINKNSVLKKQSMNNTTKFCIKDIILFYLVLSSKSQSHSLIVKNNTACHALTATSAR